MEKPRLILPVDPVTPTSHGDLDIYLPEGNLPAPCVLFVHGLYPERPTLTPRNSPFYQDYASHLARRGIVAAVVDHDLMNGFLYHEALATVRGAVDELRSLADVDSDSVGMWFFSGGGPLVYPFLADPAPWLRCVELTYPVLPGAGTPGWPTPESVVSGIKTVPTYLTLVENEIPDYVAGQHEFLQRAAEIDAPVDYRILPGAGHGFDAVQDEPRNREAVAEGIDWMVSTLTASA
jgi:acetyl esterase/lipase